MANFCECCNESLGSLKETELDQLNNCQFPILCHMEDTEQRAEVGTWPRGGESTRWFKYDRDDLCVNKSQFVPVIFEPPCTTRLIKTAQSGAS
jgi:hypothetical protein